MKKTALLPLEDVRDASLFFVISVLCFLTSLCLLTGKASYTMTASWASSVENSFTLSLDGVTIEPAALALKLSDHKEINQAHLVTNEEISDILTERLGTDTLPIGLEIPTLIEVQLSDDATLDQDGVKKMIGPFSQSHEIYQHSDWVGEVKRYLGLVQIFVFVTSGLLLGATILIVGFATHSSLYSRRDVIFVLHRFGAQDRYIANLFQARFWSLGLRSGACGAVAALGLLAGIIWFVVSEGYFAGVLPPLNLGTLDLMILFTLPFVVGYIAQLTARSTVLRALKKLF